MKKLNTTMLCIITFLFFSRFSVTAENMASIEVMLSDTGGVSFLIKLDPTLETIYTDLYVFKQGDVITKNEKDLPDPIYWHHVWDGAFVSYLGTPGKYYAVLLEAKEQITIVAGPVEFEISENMVTQTPESTPTEPPATNMIALTSSPTAKATAAETTVRATADHASSDSDRNIILWTCIGAAALVIVGVVVTVLILKKNKG
jgi:hypothetical protein